MDDLIDRKEVLDVIFNIMTDNKISHKHRALNRNIKQVAVTLTNTERHAHWIIKYSMGEPVGAICSNCESEIGYDRNGYFSETDELYCHNCGCKMDEVTQ